MNDARANIIQVLMKSMTDEGGPLTDVGYFYDRDLPDSVGLIKLVFRKGTYVIIATDDDYLEIVREAPENIPKYREYIETGMSDSLPWKSALYKPLRWIWIMTNQQGYTDGLQLEFARDIADRPVVIQLMAVGSGIDTHLRTDIGQAADNFLHFLSSEEPESVVMA